MKGHRNIEGKSSFTKALASIGALLLALVITLTSCGNAASTGDTGIDNSDNDNSEAVVAETSSDNAYDAPSKSDMFTDRDLSGDYDESSAVSIELNGSSAKTSSDNTVSVDAGTVTISKEGTYIVSGALTDGQIIVNADDTAKVQIVLDNASITSKTSAAIYVKSADKVFVTSAAGTSNTLANGGSFTAIDDSNIDGAVFAKDDICFNGSGSLTIESPAGHGVVGKDDVKFAGGEVVIAASNHGVQANDSVRIAEADVKITAGEAANKDGIHVDDGGYESGTSSDSFFYMADGSLTISSSDDGIHSENEVLIEGGSIDVSDSYEGIEGLSIKITDGNIKVKASDDGINAAGGNSSGGAGAFGSDDWRGGRGGFSDGGTDGSIDISGGNIYVQAGGDGIDANGSVTISGGYTVVCGPSQGDTSVLDYNSTATITGGTFIGTGGAGMAENFSQVDNQGLIAVSVGNQSAGSSVSLKDSSGKTIAETTPELGYAVVYVSTPDMMAGEAYTLSAGGYSEEITLSENSYSTLSGGMGGRGNMNGGMGGRGNMNGDMEGRGSIDSDMRGAPNGDDVGRMRGPRANNNQMNKSEDQSADTSGETLL